MPITTVLDSKTGILIRTVTGSFTFEEIAAAHEESLTQPGITKNMTIIWDLRQADASGIYEEDVIRIVSFFARQNDNRKDYRAALVVSRDLEFGLARVYGVYAETESLPAEIKAFRSYEEALEWATASNTLTL